MNSREIKGEDTERKKPQRKSNFFDAKNEDRPSRRARLALEAQEEAVARSGSFPRPNPRAEGKARDAAKRLNSMAKKAAQFGARNASAVAFNAATTLLKASGSGADAMALAEKARVKAKEIKLRALVAAKLHPPDHKLLSPNGGGAARNSPFKLKGHDDEEGFALFITRPSAIVETDGDLIEEEDLAYETV